MERTNTNHVEASMVHTDNNVFFCKPTNHGLKEGKRHDLALDKLQRTRGECNEDRKKQFDFINKRMHQKNEARTYNNNAAKVMVEYNQVLAKRINPLPPELQLSGCCKSLEGQNNGELLFC